MTSSASIRHMRPSDPSALVTRGASKASPSMHAAGNTTAQETHTARARRQHTAAAAPPRRTFQHIRDSGVKEVAARSAACRDGIGHKPRWSQLHAVERGRDGVVVREQRAGAALVLHAHVQCFANAHSRSGKLKSRVRREGQQRRRRRRAGSPRERRRVSTHVRRSVTYAERKHTVTTMCARSRDTRIMGDRRSRVCRSPHHPAQVLAPCANSPNRSRSTSWPAASASSSSPARACRRMRSSKPSQPSALSPAPSICSAAAVGSSFGTGRGRQLLRNGILQGPRVALCILLRK
jgi:hypothetical protein